MPLAQNKNQNQVLHGSTGAFVVDWNEFLLELLQLSKDMMVCEQAGRVGHVMVADICLCYECWDKDALAPLTGKEQYVRRDVCPQVFLTQSMLARRQTSGAVQGWECKNGCGARFETKTDVKFHMQDECSRRMVSCICGGCPERFPLCDKAEHEGQCQYVLFIWLLLLLRRSCSLDGWFERGLAGVASSFCRWQFGCVALRGFP